jgi:soluble lytic murein transglycosylase
LRDRLLPALVLTIMISAFPALAGSRPHDSARTQVAAAGGDGTLTAAVMPGIGRQARVAQPPRPLSATDAALYARIFKLQDAGQWAAAERDLGQVKDDLLAGHVLARRYLASGYRPRFQDLRAWMAEYADLPEAEAIYKLTTTKGMSGFGSVKPPVRGALQGSGIDTSDDGAQWEESTFGIDRGSSKAVALKSKLRHLLRKNDTEAATRLFTGLEAQDADPTDLDEMKLALAVDHFAGGRDAEAVGWAEQAAERSGEQLPAAHWVAGLVQWRLGKPELARGHFEAVAESPDMSGWMIAAGAFWAARANLVSHRPEVVNHWLEIAATYPRTFYGLLARRVLGYETQFSWENTPFTESDADVLMRVPGGRRALALVQVGDSQMAEEELRKIYPRAGKAVRQSMLALAQVTDMSGLAVRLGGKGPNSASDNAAFPVPELNPRGGWHVDRALVLAFIRQESAFNPRARSAKGAGGLMQVMPATAAAMGGRRAREHLNDPAVNVAVGQQYLATLLTQDPVNGNLLYLAAAYNAGPGKLAQWLAAGSNVKDPLLFVETLPSRETRAFVERVITNYWVYRSRLSQPSSSLDQIAAGEWPQYEGSESKLRRVSTR